MQLFFKILAGGMILFSPVLYAEEYIDEGEVIQEEVADQPKTLKSPPIHVTGDTAPSFPAPTQLKRKGAELKTEKKILEELERDRLRDEQARFNRMFNQKKQAPTEPTPQKHQQPVSVVSTTPKKLLKDDIEDNVFIGAQVGQASNLSSWAREATNTLGDVSAGVSVGAMDSSGVSVEGNFFWTRHKVADNDRYLRHGFYIYHNNRFLDRPMHYNMDEIHQYTGMLTVKFYPLHHLKTKKFRRFMPFLGVSLSYSRRQNAFDRYNRHDFDPYISRLGLFRNYNYNCHYFPGYNTGSQCGQWTKRTDSIDVGVNVGADVKLGNHFSIGFNVYINVYNIHNNARNYRRLYHPHYSWGQFGMYNRPVVFPNELMEETNWLITSLTAKLYF